MDKRKINIYLGAKEELHVANMIVAGSSYEEISDWHLSKYDKPMSRSKYYRYKNKATKIIANGDKKVTRGYKRTGEEDLVLFEEHLKEEIAERTNGSVIKWTHELLTCLANNERKKEPFCNMDSLKKYQFSNRYWMKYMSRNGMMFSSRKKISKMN